MTDKTPLVPHHLPGRDLAVVQPNSASSSPAKPQPVYITVTMAPPREPHGFWAAAKDWQGLEAGGLAIFAALIGAFALNTQTRTNREIAADGRGRRHRAIRAMLPLTLSSLSSWADQCGHALLQAYGPGVAAGKIPAMPPVPAEAIPNLQELVEAGSDETAESVANLLGDIQIFNTRLQQRRGFAVTGDLESHLLGIAAISAHISALFDFSRRRSNATPTRPTWEQVRTALKLMGSDETLQPGLFKRLDGRESTGKQPGYLALYD